MHTKLSRDQEIKDNESRDHHHVIRIQIRMAGLQIKWIYCKDTSVCVSISWIYWDDMSVSESDWLLVSLSLRTRLQQIEGKWMIKALSTLEGDTWKYGFELKYRKSLLDTHKHRRKQSNCVYSAIVIQLYQIEYYMYN